MKRRDFLMAPTLAMGLPLSGLAQAGYPNKTIRYIVPVAAGGGSDMIGRAVCERLSRVLNQSVVVDCTRSARWLHPDARLRGHPRHGARHAKAAL